jgi:hypothetical protein
MAFIRKFRVGTTRLLLAAGCLLGHFDYKIEMNRIVAEKEEVIARLRQALDRLHKERQYWYDLWMSMGREFEAGQNALMEEIDNLNKKLGKTEPSVYKDLVKKSFHDRHVDPPRHPVPGVKTDLASIPSPPIKSEA